MEQLQHWISACERLHGSGCQATPPNSDKRQFPRWVVDTEDGCIVSATDVSRVPRYVALSYRWPRDGLKRFILDDVGMKELQKPKSVSPGLDAQLPAVILDTITLLRNLGEKFLWVDCLCTVHQGVASVTQLEAMDEVYSDAYFTIVAAATEGLYGVASRSNNLEACNLHRTPEHHYGILLESEWATRGWTFQEHHLSRRLVYFLDPYHNGSSCTTKWSMVRDSSECGLLSPQRRPHIFWECPGCSKGMWDDGNLNPGQDRTTSGSCIGPLIEQRHDKTPTKIPHRSRKTLWPDFHQYLESACLYSSRALTFPQDIFAAFDGVLNVLYFPGGSICGMPQTYLNETLIWQPFSRSKRRLNADDRPHREFPSWSWYGWQTNDDDHPDLNKGAIIDPHSLVTGLDYPYSDIAEKYRRSWRTTHLIDWSALSADYQESLPLSEAGFLDRCRASASKAGNQSNEACTGWSSKNDENDVEYFTHCSSADARFRYPVPTPTSTGGDRSLREWPFLCSSVQRAYFRVGHCLEFSHVGDHHMGGFFTSVFELPQFTKPPAQPCSVLTLEDDQGQWAGVLRVMDESPFDTGDQIELIAISTGEVSYADLSRTAFEEKVAALRRFEYEDASYTHFWGRDWYNDDDSQMEYDYNSSSSFRGFWSRRDRKRSLPSDLGRAFGLPKSAGSGEEWKESDMYHFYNVLWIERVAEQGIAYRRAAGRVKKEMWDAASWDITLIILG